MMIISGPAILHRYNQDGYHSKFGVKAIYTSGFDDVEFVVSEHDPMILIKTQIP